jgi:hypothetical protein
LKRDVLLKRDALPELDVLRNLLKLRKLEELLELDELSKSLELEELLEPELPEELPLEYMSSSPNSAKVPNSVSVTVILLLDVSRDVLFTATQVVPLSM